jgi:hypothetical protein
MIMKQKVNKLFWRSGQEITPDTFIHADNYICSQHNLIRKLIAGKYYGLIPNEVDDALSFTVKATLNNNVLYMEQLVCCGTTEAGYMVQFGHDVLSSLSKKQLSIPNSNANAFYVVLRVNPFEQVLIEPVDNDEAPEAHSAYELAIREINQIATDELAILKIDNTHSPVIDPNYIPPCMSINSCSKLLEVFASAKTLFFEIRSIIERKQYQFGKLMYPLTLLHHELNEFSQEDPPIVLVRLIKKIMITCQFFIPDVQKIVRPDSLGEYCHNDVAIIFKSLLSCLHEIKLMVGKEMEEDFTPKI